MHFFKTEINSLIFLEKLIQVYDGWASFTVSFPTDKSLLGTAGVPLVKGHEKILPAVFNFPIHLISGHFQLIEGDPKILVTGLISH